jgi:acyl CoA:acetate/3-ketoacid CoA transferase beta subunit
MIVTEKAVFKVNNGELYLEELSENSTIDEIRRMTDAAFIISENLKKMPV